MATPSAALVEVGALARGDASAAKGKPLGAPRTSAVTSRDGQPPDPLVNRRSPDNRLLQSYAISWLFGEIPGGMVKWQMTTESNLESDTTSLDFLTENRIVVRASSSYACMSFDKLEPLSAEEEGEFNRCHAAVLAHQISAIEAALALVKLKERRLYRDRFRSFREYCAHFKGRRKTYAYGLLAFGEILSQLSATADIPALPSHEAQVRPLVAVPACDRPAVWRLAVEQRGIGEVTMHGVTEAREAFWTEHPSQRPPARKTSGGNPDTHRRGEGTKLHPILRKGRQGHAAGKGAPNARSEQRAKRSAPEQSQPKPQAKTLEIGADKLARIRRRLKRATEAIAEIHALLSPVENQSLDEKQPRRRDRRNTRVKPRG